MSHPEDQSEGTRTEPATHTEQDTTQAQEWGERLDMSKTVASGGKDSEKEPEGSKPQR